VQPKASVMQSTDLLVILPALNEAENLPQTIAHIRASVPQAAVLVVNDGSLDKTAEVAQQAGALVVTLPFNVGIGAAVQTGFQFAARYGYRIVVRNDGDGQHAAEDITCLLAALQQGKADVVIGSRFIGNGSSTKNGDYGTSFTRRLGIEIIRRLLSLITGWRITDPTSGFAAYNERAIELFARLYPHDYPEPEAIILMRRSGLTMCEIPVNMRAREYGTSSITPLRSIYYMFKVVLAILITALRRPPMVFARES
jgi:glycosyltransferase involved in cell wall biosynthesis